MAYFRSGQLFDHLYISKMKPNIDWEQAFLFLFFQRDLALRFLFYITDFMYQQVGWSFFLKHFFRITETPGGWYLRLLRE